MEQGGTPNRTRLTNAQMLTRIRAIHETLKGAYDSPRMVRELRGRGIPSSEEQVERLMRHTASYAPQAAVQGHDGLNAHPAGGAKPAESGLHAIRSESDLHIRHYLICGQMKAGSIRRSSPTCSTTKWWAGR